MVADTMPGEADDEPMRPTPGDEATLVEVRPNTPAVLVSDSARPRERVARAVREHKTERRGDWPLGHFCPD